MSFPKYDGYQNSGVAWLGQVPSHWTIRRLTQVARLESGHTPSRQRPEYWKPEECTIPWFTLADVGTLRDLRTTEIKETSQKISPLGMAHSAARLLPSETVLLSRTASVGFSAIAKLPLAVSQDFAAWICGHHVRPRYLLYFLRAMQPEFQRLMMGSTHQTIYMPDIEAIKVSLPPLEEQEEIITFLDREVTKIDELTQAQLQLGRVDGLRVY